MIPQFSRDSGIESCIKNFQFAGKHETQLPGAEVRASFGHPYSMQIFNNLLNLSPKSMFVKWRFDGFSAFF